MLGSFPGALLVPGQRLRTSHRSEGRGPGRPARRLAAGRAGECTQSNPHLMIEAFLDHNDALLSTMAVTCSREAAEEYVKGDPFLLNGMMSAWYTHKWSNMFA